MTKTLILTVFIAWGEVKIYITDQYILKEVIPFENTQMTGAINTYQLLDLETLHVHIIGHSKKARRIENLPPPGQWTLQGTKHVSTDVVDMITYLEFSCQRVKTTERMEHQILKGNESGTYYTLRCEVPVIHEYVKNKKALQFIGYYIDHPDNEKYCFNLRQYAMSDNDEFDIHKVTAITEHVIDSTFFTDLLSVPLSE